MLYTTYFARLKKLPANITPVSICGKAPDAYKGLQYKKLAPKYGFFMKYKKDGDEASYTDSFLREVLAPLDAQKTVHEIMELAGSEDVALVCYEKPDSFCHRHIVAKWLNENGIPCKEFNGGL